NLGVLIPGQSPSDDQVARVDGIIDPTVATLAALGIIYIPDVGTRNPPDGGDIGDEIFLPLADKCAWAAAGGFNQADNPTLKALDSRADDTLRRIGRPASTRRTLSTDIQLSGRRAPLNPRYWTN